MTARAAFRKGLHFFLEKRMDNAIPACAGMTLSGAQH
jgi:hypothetical protein